MATKRRKAPKKKTAKKTVKKKTAKKKAGKKKAAKKKTAKKSAKKAVKKKVVRKKTNKQPAKKKAAKKGTAKKAVKKKPAKKTAVKRASAPNITNVAGIIRTHAKNLSGKVALVQGDRVQTLQESYQRSCQVAQALKAAGVGNQDRVAFLDKNSIEHFEVFYGCALLNAVSVDVNFRLAAPEVAFIVNDARAKVFIVGPDSFRCSMRLRATSPTPKKSWSSVVIHSMSRTSHGWLVIRQSIQV